MANDFRSGARPVSTGPRPSRAGRAHAHVSGQVQDIRATKREIWILIRELQKKLKAAKDIPETQPFISFKKVTSIAELRGDAVSYHDALRKDIKKLRAWLKRLNASEGRAIRRPALRAGKAFRARAEQIFKDAEKNGTVDGEELESLQKEAETVVNMWARALRQAPTAKNMESALKALQDAAVIGAEGTEKGFDALIYGSGKMRSIAANKFRRNPTKENLAAVLKAAALNDAVGGEGERIGDRVGKGTLATHTVGPGDTYSGLSQQYYGDMGLWDIIYFHNYGLTGGGDPDTLPHGLVLEIPNLAPAAAQGR